MRFQVSKKAFCPNGCGPKSKKLSGKVASFFIPNLIFKPCCNQHDMSYFVGGCKLISDKSRYLADKDFLEDNYKEASKLYWGFSHAFKSISNVYYDAVRSSGEDSFNWFDTVEEFFQHLKKHDITYIDSEGEKRHAIYYFENLYKLSQLRLDQV